MDEQSNKIVRMRQMQKNFPVQFFFLDIYLSTKRKQRTTNIPFETENYLTKMKVSFDRDDEEVNEAKSVFYPYISGHTAS